MTSTGLEALDRVLHGLRDEDIVLWQLDGLADYRRFVESCPWLNIKAGTLLKINIQDFVLYKVAAYYYLFLIRLRTIELSGCKIS